MKIVILGGGPAGLYAGLLIKKADPSHEITLIERNPAGVTYGWGVVFSDRTMSAFQRADYKTYQQITEQFVIWDAIDVRYRGATISCGGHVIAAISRKSLMGILQSRCAELGVEMRFGVEVTDIAQLPECDLLIAADGVNSLVRRAYEDVLKPTIDYGKSKYIWLGANKVLDAFNFIFHETEHGLFQVHAYPFSGTTSTFIVECTEQAWRNAGLDDAIEAQSLAFCQSLLEEDLHGAQLLSNNSKWINFTMLRTRNWHTGPGETAPHIKHAVLLGDAVHTAHFSIGSGTKLAMEDSIALSTTLETHADMERALNEYELERKPVVETFQRAALESQTYFETIERYLGLDPMQFAFQLLTRSGRITYDDLHFRDVRYGDAVDRWAWRVPSTEYRVPSGAGMDGGSGGDMPLVAPPPIFAPLRLSEVTLPNRVAVVLDDEARVPDNSKLNTRNSELPQGVGLLLTGIAAISAEGRVAPGDVVVGEESATLWARLVEQAHGRGSVMGVQLGHAGRRGATQSRSEGLDKPLREGGWPLISASALPYTTKSQVPREMSRGDMDRVRNSFLRAAQLAEQAGLDLLQLHMAQGYLLASFLSPLSNVRTDEYGGTLEIRMRYPLEVFTAVREVWPSGKPLSVAITAHDYARGGAEVEDAISFARALKEHGCDLVQVLAGQTTPNSEPPYARGFLTHLSDRVRNEAGVPTMVGGYLTNSNEINTVLAAGRGDVCILSEF